MKKETVEEAKFKCYKEYWNEDHVQIVKSSFLTGFDKGAKWKDKTSYSEEDVLCLLNYYHIEFKHYTSNYTKPCTFTTKEWLDNYEFKK